MTAFLDTTFDFDKQRPNLGIITLDGAKDFAKMVDGYLVQWYNAEAEKQNKPFRKSTFILDCVFPRFTSGDG